MARQGVIPDWRPVLQAGGRWSALVRPGAGPRDVPQGGIAFLAAPWLGEVTVRQELRADRAARLGMMVSRELVRLQARGVTAICPVLLLDWMATAGPLVPGAAVPCDREAWEAWSWPILAAAASVVVPDVQGWDRCPSVWAQVSRALQHNLSVYVYAGRGGR